MSVKLMNHLKISQKIYVIKEGKIDKYVSSIENFNQSKIYISIPYCQQVPLVLHRGDEITIRIPTQEHVLEFKSTVLSLAQDNITMIAITHPDEVTRIQLRKYVRLDKMLDAQYAHVPGEGQEPEFKKCQALNISAGGIKVAVNEFIKQGSQLIVQFSLNVKNKNIPFSQLCTVKRTALIDYKQKLFHLGLQFDDMGRRESDLIVQYIFARMTQNLAGHKIK